ncbi:MAG TPA: PilW family protein [Spongiibacteraceae bacterium]|nr:PilW family protein [Spongiibacteraceae bacterium]
MSGQSVRGLRGQSARGFSLVELLVAMAIALLILAGVVNSFLASKETFRFNEELAFIQENARYAVERLNRDIRQAGYFGCDNQNAHVVNVLDDDFDSFVDRPGLLGFEGNATNSGFPAQINDAINDTDALIVRFGDPASAYPVNDHTPPVLEIISADTYADGTVFLVSDVNCAQQGLFESTAWTTGSAPAFKTTLTHSYAGNNCSQTIRGSSSGDCGDCSGGSCSWANPDPEYPKGSLVMRLAANAYFLADSSADATVPALFVESLGSGGVIARSELVTGVENMQITYGVDTDADGVPDQYLDASSVAASDWNNVVAVRVQLLLRSRAPVLPEPILRQDWLGISGYDTNDRFLRQVVTTTIRIRNYYG